MIFEQAMPWHKGIPDGCRPSYIGTRTLSRGNGQQPRQQAKQDYGRNQREQRVQRMKMEVRISCQWVLRSQHRTSWACDRAHTGDSPIPILPPLARRGAFFFTTACNQLVSRPCPVLQPWLTSHG